MAESVSVNPVTFRYKGVVDFDTLWKTVMGWYESKGYEVQEDKAKRNMAAMGEVLEVQFTGWRNVTDYYRFKIIVFQKYFDGNHVEVLKDGKKKDMIKGRFLFNVRGELVLDYSDRYETSPLMKSVRKFMNNYILKWQIDAIYGDELMYKVYEVADVIKEQLKMETTQAVNLLTCGNENYKYAQNQLSKMAERRIVVDNLMLEYEGLFELGQLYLVIDKWLRQRGYDKFEKRNHEHVLKDGKYIEIELEPWKKFSDYAKCTINIYLHAYNVQDVVIKKDNADVRMNKGKVKIRFIGYLVTDYEGKWEGKPFFYFLRTVFDKYIYKVGIEKLEGGVAEEVAHLYQNIRAFLNLTRY